MKTLFLVNSLVFAFSALGILLVFFLSPFLIWIIYLIKGQKAVNYSPVYPSLSLITVVRNAEALIVDKINNFLALNYPAENYEIIIYSDGSTDKTAELAAPFVNKKIRFYSSSAHEGKNSGINRAVQNCSGEIVVFSDVDSILDINAIFNLVRNFSDPNVGGVCGQRVIRDVSKELISAQSDYIGFDSFIKKLESRVGSITSNDGKLYAFRRELFQDIPPAVTDDLYVCLSIISLKHRFLFEPDAMAYIKAPSRNPRHEIMRRRRIVSRSLRGIYLMRKLLNPFKYGIFSIRLFINKIIRRLLPICLFLLFISSLFLYSYNLLFEIALFFQVVFYVFAFSHLLLSKFNAGLKLLNRAASSAFYFCIGNFGTLYGLFDFILGRKIIRWEPLKTDRKGSSP